MTHYEVHTLLDDGHEYGCSTPFKSLSEAVETAGTPELWQGAEAVYVYRVNGRASYCEFEFASRDAALAAAEMDGSDEGEAR